MEGLGFQIYSSNPMSVTFADFRARCMHYLYTWIPRVKIVVVQSLLGFMPSK